MYFIMKISDMCLKKNLNFKMCRNWRKTENVEWVGHMRRHSEYVGHMRRHNQLELTGPINF